MTETPIEQTAEQQAADIKQAWVDLMHDAHETRHLRKFLVEHSNQLFHQFRDWCDEHQYQGMPFSAFTRVLIGNLPKKHTKRYDD